MAKKKKSPLARKNANNRKRGKAFEKKIAKSLNMYVVPYSGSNSRFGWGDIRDNEGTGPCNWLGEAKKRIVPSELKPRHKIPIEDIEQIEDECEIYGAEWFFAFSRPKVPFGFVMINNTTMLKMIHADATLPLMLEIQMNNKIKNLYISEIEMADRLNVKNFYKQPKCCVYFKFKGKVYVIMTLKQFTTAIHSINKDRWKEVKENAISQD